MQGDASKPKLSKQRLSQLRRIEVGLCAICSKPRGSSSSKVYCKVHVEERRLAARAKAGCKPWRPGGRGRPIKD